VAKLPTSAAGKVNSLKRGLEILQHINQHESCRVRDLYQSTGLPKPTIVRMLGTLRDAGYVVQRSDGRYEITARTLSLSSGYSKSDQLMSVASAALRRFRREFAWPSYLAIFDSDAMVILDAPKLPSDLILARGIGTRLPMTTTAMGRAYLANCPEPECETILARLRQLQTGPDVILDDHAWRKRIFQLTRERGFATSDLEYQQQARTVAVPIIANDVVLACVNVLTAASVMSMAEAEQKFTTPLMLLADKISIQMWERFAQNLLS
jgi:IclR family mhp operon transcriptional activator